MKLLYIAGPYRDDTENGVFENIIAARDVATFVASIQKDWFPVTPHLNTMFMGGVREDEYWLEGDLEIIKRCDAVLLMDDWVYSKGARKEKDVAEEFGIPCFTEDEFFGNSGQKANIV